MDAPDHQLADMRVEHGRPEALVPQKRLDIPDVCSGLQKVCGKTVAQQVDAAFFINTRLLLLLTEHRKRLNTPSSCPLLSNSTPMAKSRASTYDLS